MSVEFRVMPNRDTDCSDPGLTVFSVTEGGQVIITIGNRELWFGSSEIKKLAKLIELQEGK